MKYLEPVTLVNSPNEIYQLFTEIFPEMIPQVQLWFPLAEFTETDRMIDVYLEDGVRIRFGARREADTEPWTCAPVYMIPDYMQEELPGDLNGVIPAADVDLFHSKEEAAELFCRMFPSFRDRVVNVEKWLWLGRTIRGIRITLTDGKHVAFKLLNTEGAWNAFIPCLLPRPDEDRPKGMI